MAYRSEFGEFRKPSFPVDSNRTCFKLGHVSCTDFYKFDHRLQRAFAACRAIGTLMIVKLVYGSWSSKRLAPSTGFS